MSKFADLTEKLLEYFTAQELSLNNEDLNIFFNELMEDVEYTDEEIIEKYEESNICQARAPLKEMLDSMSTLNRAKQIRDKTEYYQFAINDIIRSKACVARFSDKINTLEKESGLS